jgi:hypothetical protein
MRTPDQGKTTALLLSTRTGEKVAESRYPKVRIVSRGELEAGIFR